MKRLLSILLLAVFAFNLGGYYVFFWAMKHTANQQLAQQLDAHAYDESEVIELKIPFTLPYPIYNEGFERVEGTIEHNGQILQLVKQKVANDTLHIVCIKDSKQEQLAADFKSFTQRSQDLPANGKQSMQVLNKLIKDFQQGTPVHLNGANGWTLLQSYVTVTELFSSPEQRVPAPPPKV